MPWVSLRFRCFQHRIVTDTHLGFNVIDASFPCSSAVINNDLFLIALTEVRKRYIGFK